MIPSACRLHLHRRQRAALDHELADAPFHSNHGVARVGGLEQRPVVRQLDVARPTRRNRPPLPLRLSSWRTGSDSSSFVSSPTASGNSRSTARSVSAAAAARIDEAWMAVAMWWMK